VKKLEREKEKPFSFRRTIVSAGFGGGVIWSLAGYLAYFFNFTEIRPNMLWKPWVHAGWKAGWIGDLAAVLAIGILGIAAAFLYYFSLRNVPSVWAGVLYGGVLFVFVFYLLNPVLPGFNPPWKLDANTIVTSLCLYVLFGMFVGYTISYEYGEYKRERKGGEGAGSG